MSTFAATLINWTALWKIAVAAFIGGAGIVIAFGLTLLGLERAKTSRTGSSRLAHRALAGACGTFCIAVLAIGIYAMTDKPSSKPAPKPTTGSGARERRAG